MKKRIILAVSVLVLLALAGGGVYWYRLPAKAQKEEDFGAEMDRYIDAYYDLLEEDNFVQAQEILKEFRAHLAGKRISPQEHARYSFCTLVMENALLCAQKKYEKMKENFPEMERRLTLLEKTRCPEKDLLVARYEFVSDQSQYFFQRREYEKALALLEKFVAENGGEEKLEKQQFFSLFSLYGSLANCSLKLNRKEEAKKYYRKALTAAEDPRVRHLVLINLAEMLDAKKDLDEIARYVEEAHAGFQSQKSCYYLAEIRVRQGKTEEAKKYCSLAFSCRNVPRVEQKKLEELKKKLLERGVP